MAKPLMEERGSTEGNLLVDRRRPGRRKDLSPALIALLRRPSTAQEVEIKRRISTYDALEAPEVASELRTDPVRVAGVLGSVAFCAASWFGILHLLFAT